MTSFTRPNILSTATRKSTNTRVVLGGPDQHQIQQSPKVPSNHLDPVVVDPFFLSHLSRHTGVDVPQCQHLPDQTLFPLSFSLIDMELTDLDVPLTKLTIDVSYCLHDWMNEGRNTVDRWDLEFGLDRYLTRWGHHDFIFDTFHSFSVLLARDWINV